MLFTLCMCSSFPFFPFAYLCWSLAELPLPVLQDIDALALPSVMLTQEASSFSVNFLRELRRGYLSSVNLALFPWRKTCFYLFICPQVLIKGTTIHNAWSPYAQASVVFTWIFSLQGFAFYTMLSEQPLSYKMIVPYLHLYQSNHLSRKQSFY